MPFYVYEHWRPDQDLCFYVGKGNGRRAQRIERRNADHSSVVAALAEIGMCVEVRMVASNISEDEAFRIERVRIAFWRSAGIALTNKTAGGEGFSGFVRPFGIPLSESARQKVSDARKGMKFTAEHRAKLSAKKIGRPRPPFTDLTRAKMRAAAAAREDAKRERFGDHVRRGSKIKETS